MGRMNFQYDETGTTYLYVFLTFLCLLLTPATFYLFPSELFASEDSKRGSRRRAAHAVEHVAAKDSFYYSACLEKARRLQQKDPWARTKSLSKLVLLSLGWALVAVLVYQVMQFDYEMANFDPYEILGVGFDASAKEIKKKYRELSLKFHPDKPEGDEKKFMKLTKAYDALTDETARYNWEHYGNPDGPQAMQFGIGLPAWIVEEKNSIWVLGVYALVFMIGLPVAVYYWWSNSIKFSGEQVLLDTTQLYYYFFHKTPHMMLKRVLMVLAASLEFERGHNSEIVERPTDNIEIPQLMKSLPNLGINNKEKPLCFGYSLKARALLFAHLSRLSLPLNTLHQDRLYVIKKCPFLVHEMVNCISQLILLAHAGRIGRLPSLDSIEAAMKLSPMIVQALWDKQSPLLQLPHIEEEMLKHFFSRRRNIKTLQQLARMKDVDRRSVLRKLADEQYHDAMRVLAAIPVLEVSVTTEVVDDEDQHVVTAGSIITVTLALTRKTLESTMALAGSMPESLEPEEPEETEEPAIDDIVELSVPADSETTQDETAESKKANSKKVPVWRKPEKKKKGAGSKKSSGNKKQSKQKNKQGNKQANDGSANANNAGESTKASSSANDSQRRQNGQMATKRLKAGENGDKSDNSDASDSENESEREEKREQQSAVEEAEDDEAEWQKFQKKINKREKVLEGRSKLSHSVHCPYFTDDKQEYWWAYIADRKSHALVTPPTHITALVDHEDVELKFTAPHKPGHYTFSVCIRSDSYLGVDHVEDIRLDVHEAREAVTEHPQWEFEDDDEEDENKNKSESEDEFATDDDFEQDDDDDEDDDEDTEE